MVYHRVNLYETNCAYLFEIDAAFNKYDEWERAERRTCS